MGASFSDVHAIWPEKKKKKTEWTTAKHVPISKKFDGGEINTTEN